MLRKYNALLLPNLLIVQVFRMMIVAPIKVNFIKCKKGQGVITGPNYEVRSKEIRIRALRMGGK